VRDGTHTLGDDSTYEPSHVGPETGTQAHRLGGSGPVPASDESVEERRRRILQATLSRLEQEEQEIENSCGTLPTGPSQ
jgi:hypothetical protein